MAERDPAVHAAGALIAHLGFGLGEVDLVPVPDPLGNRARVWLGALDFDETGGLTH